MEIGGIAVEICRKRVKNINLYVYPPDGRVRVSAPHRLPEEELRAFLEARLPWIERQRARVRSAPPAPTQQYTDGAAVPVWGGMYTLCVREQTADLEADHAARRLYVPTDSTPAQRERALDKWYRAELDARIPPLMDKWQCALGVQAAEWRLKRMKTRWGSCNVRDRRVWLNVRLAEYPPAALDYVVLHELAHLLVPGHDRRFYAVLDAHCPEWRAAKALL